MSAASSPILPLTLPLRGSRLIEASAGTGKTWTIAALVVRLVLGHGRSAEQAPSRPFLPSEILVMTFTRAATRELADRIRSRLAEAARCFAAEEGSAQDSGDDFLQALRADYPVGPVRREAAWRLAAAAEAMDDAAIHTIDAWCHRMLREHAFDSGQFGDEQLDSDESDLIAQAVRDWWRCEVYPRGDAELALLGRVWADVGVCERDLTLLLPLLPWMDPLADDATTPTAEAGVGAMLRFWHEQLLALADAGAALRVRDLRSWLVAQVEAPAGSPFHGGRLRLADALEWLEALSAWCADPIGAELSAEIWTRLERLTPDGLIERLKKGRSAEPPPASAWLHQLLTQRAGLDPRSAIRLAATRQVAQRIETLKRRAGRIGFADLLSRLDAALHGPQGEGLRQRIVAQAPVVLIDEFQDTSLAQMRLFERLYPPQGLDAEGLTLLLIGDPKQSIYGFRGADIGSYLRARAATAPRHHALGTNHRSDAALVDVVNRLFESAEREAPGGAFAWGGTEGAAIPFVPVAAQGRSQRWVGGAARRPAPVLTLGLSEAVHDAETARRLAARWAARALVERLADPGAGFVEGEDGRFQRLAPRDIAVLVHSRREAELMRRELLRHGVRSVYLSDQDSVMASTEATDLLLWLRALAHPTDPELARAAWAGGALGEPLPRLAAWLQDDERWDDCLNLLRRLAGVWMRQGVLAMLRMTLHERGLPARWLAEPGGERRLTNVLHLGELLQLASRELDGAPALLRWFEGQIETALRGEGIAAEEQIVRLESEADLVRIVTIHKSKGLEYPLVFLPFAGLGRQRRHERSRPLVLSDASQPGGGRRVRFDADEAELLQAEAEQRREQLRLLYVALTRPRHALWIGVVSRGQFATTALAHLLQRAGSSGPPDESGLTQRFESLWAEAIAAGQARIEGIEAGILKPAVARDLAGPSDTAEVALRPLPAYTGRFERDWSIGSFSAWVRDLPREVHQPPLAPLRIEALREEWQQAPIEALTEAHAPRNGPQALRHRFAQGPRAGSFLHELLQDLAERGFGQLRHPAAAARLQRRWAIEALPGLGEGAEAQARSLELQQWLIEVIEAPLPGGGSLEQVSQRLAEMEFWMPAHQIALPEVDALCRRAWWPQATRPALSERHQQGLMMGFADLVFEQGGRYWVLDYKSNRLGDDDAAYTEAALRQAVLNHRYDVQAALYLLALHRLLRQRFGAAYEPQRQLGGALLMFLRGLQGPAGGLVHLPADEDWLDELDDTLGLGEAQA
jgi:exodeoxyribonuclease V beta subunit